MSTGHGLPADPSIVRRALLSEADDQLIADHGPSEDGRARVPLTLIELAQMAERMRDELSFLNRALQAMTSAETTWRDALRAMVALAWRLALAIAGAGQAVPPRPEVTDADEAYEALSRLAEWAIAATGAPVSPSAHSGGSATQPSPGVSDLILSEVEREIIDVLRAAQGELLSSSDIAKRSKSGYDADYIRKQFPHLRELGMIEPGKGRRHRIAG